MEWSATDAEPLSPTDSQLLARYVVHRDQTAFAALLLRHGRMVFGICRRILRRHHEAEDAFQATFLLLAQNAASVSRPEFLASWLHRVAHRAALSVKKAAAKRQQIEQCVESGMDASFESSTNTAELWSETAPMLDEELARLSEELRTVVILCDVEGWTRKEAARRLDWPEATVSSRLMKARSLLAQRLTRRGVVLSAVTLGAILSQNAASAAVPSTLVASTLTATATVSAQTATTGMALMKIVALSKAACPPMLLGKFGVALLASTFLVTAGLALQPAKVPAPPAAAPAQLESVLSEIAEVYRQHYASIKSLRIECRGQSEDLIDSEVLWKAWRKPPVPIEGTTTLVIDHEKTYCKERSSHQSMEFIAAEIKKLHPQRFEHLNAPATSVLSYQEIQEWLPRTPMKIHESIHIFDGQFLRDNNSGYQLADDQNVRRPHFSIRHPSQTDRQMFNAHNYLDLILFGVTGSALPHDQKYRERYRLPDLLTMGTWQVIAEHEPLDGADCLVIESSETDKLWLERDAGYALRRHTKQHPHRIDRDFQDLRKVSDTIWMPQTIVEIGYAGNPIPQEYLGKPAMRMRYELTQVELNQQVSEDTFKLVPPEHSVVFDMTLKPLDASGNPLKTAWTANQTSHVRYVQPADPADLSTVVRQAQIALGKEPVTSQISPIMGQSAPRSFQISSADEPSAPASSTSGRIRWFVGGNIALFLIVGGFLVYRRRT